LTEACARPGPIRDLVLYFLRLGLLGFGGPVALVGQMERELVTERGWLSKEQMREAIAIFSTENWMTAIMSRWTKDWVIVTLVTVGGSQGAAFRHRNQTL
jgi:hypothetical protein